MAVNWSNIDWGSLLGSAASIYSANQNADATAAAARSTQTNPFSVFSPFGSVVNNGQRGLVINPGNNPFTQMFTTGGLTMGANAFSAPSAAYYGAPKEIVDAANGAMNTDAAAADRLALLRSQAAPESNRNAIALREKLFGQGRNGSTGGANEQRAFLEAENNADLNRQITAADWANARAQQRFSNAVSATGVGGQIQGQQFNQFAASQAGQMNPFMAMLQAGSLGVGAGGGVAPGAALAAAQASNVPYQMGAQAVGELAPMLFGNSKTIQPVNTSVPPSRYGGDPRAVGY